MAHKSAMRTTIGISLLLFCLGCNRKPAESNLGSTDTIQSTPTSTSGTTATQTGGGPPVTTDTSATGNASGSGSTGTTGTLPGGAPPATNGTATTTHT